MQTHHALRAAAPAIAAQYPLPVDGVVRWARHGDGFVTELPLPALMPGAIVIPSFSMVDGAAYGFRFTLCENDGRRWPLAPVRMPSADADPPTAATDDVTAHIDCWHVHGPVSGHLRLDVQCRWQPERFLLTVNARLRAFTASPGTATGQRLAVPAISQMSAEPGIRRRICSPACTAMLLAFHGVPAALADVAADCHDARARMYGIWPLAIHTASRAGLIGAVEAFTDLDQAAALLDAGVPVIATIRFESGKLSGAPLAATAGHLVVLTGLDAQYAYVNDPAAATDVQVARRYARDEFAAAWLDDRGAGYLLVPS